MAKGDVRKAHALIQTCSPVTKMRVRDGVDEPVTAGRAHITMPEGREKPSSAAASCVEGWCQDLATEASVASDRTSALSRAMIPDGWPVSCATVRAVQTVT